MNQVLIQYPCSPITRQREPLPKQYEFHSSPARFRAYIGGAGSGKTLAGCYEAIKLSLMYPKNAGVICAPTFPMLRDATMRTFFSICPEEIIKRYDKESKTIEFYNGSIIMFRSFDDPEKARGPNLGWFYMDEGSEMSEELFLQLTYRLRLDTVPVHYGYITTNPNGKDWIYNRFVKNPTADYRWFHATMIDNIHLPPEFIKSAMEGSSEDYIKRFVYAEFVSFEGQVLSEFSAIHNVVQPFPIPYDWYRFEALDFGNIHPTAFVFAAEDKEGNLYFYDEYQGQRMTSDEIVRTFIDKRRGIEPEVTVYDTAGNREDQTSGTSIVQQVSDGGIMLTPANKDLQGSILRMQTGFKNKKIFIFSTCVQLIHQIENVRWEKPRMINGIMLQKERVVKKDDDLFDAARYLVMQRPDYYSYPVERPHPTEAEILQKEMRLEPLHNEEDEHDEFVSWDQS